MALWHTWCGPLDENFWDFPNLAPGECLQVTFFESSISLLPLAAFLTAFHPTSCSKATESHNGRRWEAVACIFLGLQTCTIILPSGPFSTFTFSWAATTCAVISFFFWIGVALLLLWCPTAWNKVRWLCVEALLAYSLLVPSKVHVWTTLSQSSTLQVSVIRLAFFTLASMALLCLVIQALVDSALRPFLARSVVSCGDGGPTSSAGGTAPPSNIEDHSSIWGRLFFTYIWRVMRRAYLAGQLHFCDLPSISALDSPSAITDEFTAAWTKAVSKHPKHCPSLILVLYRLFWRSFLMSGLLMLFASVALILIPFTLHRLLDYMGTEGSHPLHGFTLAIALGMLAFIKQVTEHQFWYIGVRCALHAQTALMGYMYRASQGLTPSGRAKYGPGQLTNIMTVDATRVLTTFLPCSIHWGGWASLTVIGVGTTQLYRLLGFAAFVGLGVMALCLVTSALVAKQSGKYSRRVQCQRDARGALASAALDAIKSIKCNAMEASVSESVRQLREVELDAVFRKQTLSGVCSCLTDVAVFLGPVTCFAAYSLWGPNHLTTATAFSALAWFSTIRTPLSTFPYFCYALVDCLVSFRRLEEFFSQACLDADSAGYDPVAPGLMAPPVAHQISIVAADLSWGGHSPVLRDINLQVPQGAFVAIVGPVGSGKTSLLAAIAGDMTIMTGSVHSSGRMALVTQDPWIQNLTLRDNILFGMPFDSEWYSCVLQCCQLGPDLLALPNGDLTEIGEHGIGLSGGQRQRVALARAIYAAADIILLDDVLSALDATVGNQVFTQALMGVLKGRTRIMATHALQYLSSPAIDLIVILGPEGTIRHEGTYGDLLERGLLQELQLSAKAVAKAQCEIEEVENTELLAQVNWDPSALRVKEAPRIGGISPTALKAYFTAMPFPLAVLLLLAYLAIPMLDGWNTFVLASWTKKLEVGVTLKPLEYYVAGTVGLAFLVLLKLIFLLRSTIIVSRTLHMRLLWAVLLSPCAWLDQTPSGVILNRLVADQATLDEVVPPAANQFLTHFLRFIVAVCIMAWAVPYSVLILPILLLPYGWLANHYRWAARDLRRLDSVKRSPILSHFAESVRGASVIRAFGQQERFCQENLDRIYDNIVALMNNLQAQQWITVVSESLGCCVLLASACLAVYGHQRGNLSAQTIGILLNYAIQLPNSSGWVLKAYCVVEMEFVAVERIQEFIDLPVENGHPLAFMKTSPGDLSPSPRQWPARGELQCIDLRLSYSPETPVLRGVSFHVPAGAKVAIIGRTGAGKSSLSAVLLQLYPHSGSILIDGLDVSTLDLGTLRRGVRYLPQEARLFGSTLATAIGGKDACREAVWDAIRTVGLEPRISALPSQLDTPLPHAFSKGEHQLMCLAHLLYQGLPPGVIVICDEGTAALDITADGIIHDALFALPNTLLFICHRLAHVQRFDLVIAMDAGQVKEVGNPITLLADPCSTLSCLTSAGHATHGAS